jgi:hypothetical protein
LSTGDEWLELVVLELVDVPEVELVVGTDVVVETSVVPTLVVVVDGVVWEMAGIDCFVIATVGTAEVIA